MVWDPALHFERCYSLTEREDNHQSHRRRVKEWVSDMVSMPNSHKLAISSTGRDIRFFDATSTQYFEEFYLYGKLRVELRNTCVAGEPNQKMWTAFFHRSSKCSHMHELLV